ncbi:MAG: pilus assembly protein PilM [Deltaproteobacteria bacterium]|nr:pilus assembly protein PilM [Deltaproteobacteria bacterium]
MAQRVFGVELVGVRSYPVAFGPEPALERSLKAVSDALEFEEQDLVSVGVPGDRVLLRALEIPFTDPKRLQAIIANELADDLPWEIEDLTYDFAPSQSTGRVSVAAARREQVAELLAELAEHGVEPRQLAVAPLGYGGLIRRLYPQECVLILDLGHERSNVCLVHEGQAVYARTISRGGYQITSALRDAFQLGYHEAEQFKHTRALMVDDLERLDGGSREVARATAKAVAPLVREIKRSVMVAQTTTGLKAARVVLCGGTSHLSGIDGYLGVELGLPVEHLSLAADATLVTPAVVVDEAGVALAISLGLDVGRRGVLDFRQGEFAFKTDSSIFREKMRFLAISALVILVFGGLNAWASLRSLRGEEQALEAQLKRETRRLFGKPQTDGVAISRTLRRAASGKGSGIPAMTAVDIFEQISQRVPPRDKAKLDVTRLDIKAGKTSIRGTTDSRSSVGKIVKALKAYDCFDNVAQGKISEVSGGAKQFSLTATTRCF